MPSVTQASARTSEAVLSVCLSHACSLQQGCEHVGDVQNWPHLFPAVSCELELCKSFTCLRRQSLHTVSLPQSSGTW